MLYYWLSLVFSNMWESNWNINVDETVTKLHEFASHRRVADHSYEIHAKQGGGYLRSQGRILTFTKPFKIRQLARVP